MPKRRSTTGPDIELSDLTTKGLLRFLVGRVLELGDKMTELTNATADLHTVVAAAVNLLDRTTELQAQVETLTTTLSDERLADQVEDEAFRTEIQTGRDDASAAVQAINTDVEALRAALPAEGGTGGEGTTPAEGDGTGDDGTTPVEGTDEFGNPIPQ